MATIKHIEANGVIRHVTFTCPKHGDYVVTMMAGRDGKLVGPSDECPRCRSEYFEEHREEIEAERRKEEEFFRRSEEKAKAEEQQRRMNAAMSASNIPREYRNVDLATITFADKGNTETLRQVRLYAERFDEVRNSGVGLFLYGETGTGKTHLACALLRALMPEVRGLYAMTWEIIRAVKSAGFQDDPLLPFIEAPLLVIDEIGVQFGSKFEETALYPLIDSRVSERRPTIFISNVQPDTKDAERRGETLRGMLGERLWDRVQYRSIFLPLHGASVRKRYRSVDELLEGGE